MDSLQALGLVHEVSGKRFQTPGWDPGEMLSNGLAARFWPSATLVEAAETVGVLPHSVRHDFRFVPPAKAPKVSQPLDVRRLEMQLWGRVVPLRQLARGTDPEATLITADVEAHNELARRTTVSGCTPPRWRRIFHGAWQLHGRWYAAGSDGLYQTLPQEMRSALRIGGEAVVELDVKASHLTILRGLAGFPALERDPYQLPGVPRSAAKRWALETMGKGHPVTRWASKTPDADRAQDVRKVGEAMIAAHPYLAAPAEVVPAELVDRLGAPQPDALVWYYLAAVEATGMTTAMRHLREVGVLSLPVHDSLIVPESAREAARQAIVTGFQAACGVAPEVEAKAVC